MRPAAPLTLIVVLVLSVAPAGGTPAVTLTSPGATPIGREQVVTTLFTTALPALTPPATTRTVLLSYVIVGPGGQVTRQAGSDACCPGTQVTHVLTGTYTLRGDGPLQVVRGDHEGTRAPQEAIAPGTEVRLQAGDTAVSAGDLPTRYANPGTDSVHLLVGRVGSRVPPPHTSTDVLSTTKASSPAPPLPSGPVAVTLQQATLPPDGILPAPPPGSFRTVLTGLALAPLETGRDGAVQNRGETPVVVYMLTLHPVGSTAAPPRQPIVGWGA